ncbi:sensor histidine kinase [Streptomyces fenghuangensis]
MVDEVSGTGTEHIRRLRLRWVHLLLGGALLMPYFLLTTVVISIAVPGADPLRQPGWQLAAYGLSLPPAAATALLPLTRTLESTAARALCRTPGGELTTAPATSWAARRRTAVWFTLHLGLGAPVSGATLAIPPAAAVLTAMPFSRELRESRWQWHWNTPDTALWTAPATAAALLAALVAAVWAAGALLARCAPALLGPAPADRLAAAEARAAALAARDRIARELHDSVGHALSAVALQAGAARTVLGLDPEFVRRALTAIEETARHTTGELDTVLGMLREDGETPSRTPAGPTLAELGALLERTRAGGTPVTLTTGPGPWWETPELLPEAVSREAYRIVQEGLSNALRHAGRAPVTLSLTLRDEELLITMENPLHPRSGPHRNRPGGGTGLRGTAERAAALGGRAQAGPQDGNWRLTVHLPLGGER